jgi:hypothetical protein
VSGWNGTEWNRRPGGLKIGESNWEEGNGDVYTHTKSICFRLGMGISYDTKLCITVYTCKVTPKSVSLPNKCIHPTRRRNIYTRNHVPKHPIVYPSDFVSDFELVADVYTTPRPSD